ncbi:MAG TPA: penicillin-insensitive murein endopeptidase [Polyangiaceae bacterium]|nr:penicillin-insensitive murein endopeptidase [Polyangiaceae bacterium]
MPRFFRFFAENPTTSERKHSPRALPRDRVVPKGTSAAYAASLLLFSACAGAPRGERGQPSTPASQVGDAASQSADSEGAAAALADAAPLATTETVDEETAESDDKDEIDDGAESSAMPTEGRTYKHPLDGWTKAQIETELTKNATGLGSMSIGSTNGGALFNGVQMTTGQGWELVDADHAWGTRETVDFLAHCLNRVEALLPGSPKMFIGHISGPRGGHLSPHVSHQAGRDVDISYYYSTDQARWYATAKASNLDRARTWAFIKTLIVETDVELILMDRSVQRLVRSYAIDHGEDRTWVDQIFDGSAALPPLIRHAKGHASHLHLRFYNPLAQETGRRAYDLLLKRRIIEPPSRFVRHKVKEGETLGHLARKYGVSAKAIQQANGMKTNLIRATQDYKIPRRGGVKALPRAVIPARRLPPEHVTG